MPSVTGYIQASHYGYGTQRKTLIVIHCMQAPQSANRARNTANYFRTTTRAASTQFCTDNREVWQCLDVASQTPYGAGYGTNRDGIHIEQPGYAEWTRNQWLTGYGYDQLKVLAKLVGELCDEYQIPRRFLSANDLRAGNRSGIIYHVTATEASGGSGHWDPGPHWPEGVFLGYLGAVAEPPPIGLGRNNNRDAVRNIQRQMQGVGLYSGEIDGDFGPATNHSVYWWKKHRLGITDGNGDWTVETFVKTIAWAKYINAIGEQAPKPKFKTLTRNGENNADHVRTVQLTMSNVHLYEGRDDGVFDAELEDAVKQWQEFLTLPVSGGWDDETARATFAWGLYIASLGQ